MQSVSSLLSMETDLSDAEPGTINDGSTAKKSKQRKRKSFMVDEEGQMGSREKLAKKILLSLTRPSYVLRLGPKPLRKEHRTRLRYLLRRLVNQHHWVEASGVLSAYIKGTLNETSPFRNRLKFWVLMELLNRVKNNSINPTSDGKPSRNYIGPLTRAMARKEGSPYILLLLSSSFLPM